MSPLPIVTIDSRAHTTSSNVANDWTMDLSPRDETDRENIFKGLEYFIDLKGNAIKQLVG